MNIFSIMATKPVNSMAGTLGFLYHLSSSVINPHKMIYSQLHDHDVHLNFINVLPKKKNLPFVS